LLQVLLRVIRHNILIINILSINLFSMDTSRIPFKIRYIIGTLAILLITHLACSDLTGQIGKTSKTIRSRKDTPAFLDGSI